MRSVFDVAVKMLAGRPKSRARLFASLEAKGYPAQQIDAALDRCTELGYLNDARYAEDKTRSGLAEGRSISDVVRRLEADGIAGAEKVVRALAEGHDEVAAARALLQKKRLSGVRAARFLAGRGYSEDVIGAVVLRGGGDYG